jgi:hypothetical protein
MKAIGVRQLSGLTTAAAAQSADPLGFCNGGVLYAALLPVTPRWVENLVEQNLSQLVYNIEIAEKDRARGEPIFDIDDSVGGLSSTAPADPAFVEPSGFPPT